MISRMNTNVSIHHLLEKLSNHHFYLSSLMSILCNLILNQYTYLICLELGSIECKYTVLEMITDRNDFNLK